MCKQDSGKTDLFFTVRRVLAEDRPQRFSVIGQRAKAWALNSSVTPLHFKTLEAELQTVLLSFSVERQLVICGEPKSPLETHPYCFFSDTLRTLQGSQLLLLNDKMLEENGSVGAEIEANREARLTVLQ